MIHGLMILLDHMQKVSGLNLSDYDYCSETGEHIYGFRPNPPKAVTVDECGDPFNWRLPISTWSQEQHEEHAKRYFKKEKCCLCGDKASYKIAEEPIGYYGHGYSQVVCKHCFNGIFVHGNDWLRELIKANKNEATA